jgi:diguanylate cyclase (GGDEF)-like protein
MTLPGWRSYKQRFIPMLTGLFYTSLVAGLLTWSLQTVRQSMLGMAIQQASAYIEQVITTRTWNAEHGGVYVAISAKDLPNPYLDAAEREIIAENGLHLVKINPAYMTRQIADIANQRSRLLFHITGLNPLRPGNAPDSWEEAALKSLMDGGENRFAFVSAADGSTRFRFMSPLRAEPSCLRCHGERGYREGDLLGGLSASIDAEPLMKVQRTHTLESCGVYFSLWLLGIAGIAGATRYLRERQQAEERLQSMSYSDELTGLSNRRGFFALAEQQLKLADRTKTNTSLIYLDLDGMKRINDTLGHQAGDRALMETADVLRETFRGSDIIARMGGDEFVVLLQDAAQQSDESIVDRLEANLQVHNHTAGRPFQLALSLGIAHYDPARPCSLEELISQADALMYQQKQQRKSF